MSDSICTRVVVLMPEDVMPGLGVIFAWLLGFAADLRRDCYFIAEQPAPAPHLAHPEGCATLHIGHVTVPRVSRSCEHRPADGVRGV